MSTFSRRSNGAGGIDYPYLRYADVLLGLRKRSTQPRGATAEAYGTVNHVRARAKIPNLTAGLTQAQFRDSVFLERRYELAMEGHGVFDSRRNWAWSKARIEAYMATIANANKTRSRAASRSSTPRPIGDKWKLYPIPVRPASSIRR